MKLKPIENPSNALKIRLFAISALIVGAIILNVVWISKKEDNENVLGNESERITVTPTPISERAKKIIDDTIDEVEETAGSVLGEAAQTAIDTATQSAQTVTNYIFDNTVGNVVKQIDKLPEEQKEQIKKEICE